MLRAAAVVFVVLAGIGAVCRAADGDLDPGFADAGRFVLAPADVSLSVGAAATQSDGRLLLAGGRWDTHAEPFVNEVVLWRLDGSGRLDPTFGDAGAARWDLGESYAQATGLALARNGDLLVSAVAGFHVLRLTPGGLPDAAFGTGGHAALDFAALGYSGAAALALAEDGAGRVIVVGNVSGGGLTEPALARLSAAGVPDPAFGPGGCRVMALGPPEAPRSADLLSVIATPAGGVVAAGSATVGEALGARGFLALRLDTDGQPDAAFGDAGIAFFPPALGADRARQVIVDHDRVLLIGSCGAATDGGALCVLRLRADGRADPAYGSGGWARTSATLPVRADVTAALQSDGKLVLAASTPLTSPAEFVVARVTADGWPDPSFGAAGHVTIAFDSPAGASSQARAVALQGGRAVVAGQVSGSGPPALAAVRLDSDLLFAGGFD